MIRVKNEITAKDINGNVNSQIFKPLLIRMLIGLAIACVGIALIVFAKPVLGLGIVLTIIGGIFIILLIVMYFIVRNSAIKQNNFGSKKIEYEYRFDPRFFSVTVYIKGKKQGVMNLNYQDISKYKETKNSFYIFLKNQQTLIISKTVKYAEGSPEALHKVLSERASKKAKKIKDPSKVKAIK